MAKGVLVELDKPRYIKFTLASWRKMSRDMDEKTMEAIFDAFQSDGDYDFRGTIRLMAAMCDLLWLGLIHEDPQLTAEAVGGMVDADNYDTVFAALGTAFRDAFPEGTASNPTKESPSIGPSYAGSDSARSASARTSSGA